MSLGAQMSGSANILLYPASIADHRLSFELTALSGDAFALLKLRLNAFLRPRGHDLFSHVEGQIHASIPSNLTIALAGATELSEAMSWHRFITANHTTGRHVLEMVLVQVVEQAIGEAGDYRTWHSVACRAIKDTVDPNFACVLDVQW